jgi:phage gpG-like protein
MNATEQLKQDLAKLYRSLPSKVGIIAKQFINQNFRLQAWQNSGIEPWARRKSIEKGARRSLLIKTGRLRRATTYSIGTGYVLMRNNTPYAPIHNDGGSISQSVMVKSHTRRAHSRRSRGGNQAVPQSSVASHQRNQRLTIPRRRFMGDSATFDQQLDKLILKELDKIEQAFINNKK